MFGKVGRVAQITARRRYIKIAPGYTMLHFPYATLQTSGFRRDFRPFSEPERGFYE